MEGMSVTGKGYKKHEQHVKNWIQHEGKQFLRAIGVKEGQIVLDFGCGAGHYAIPAARIAEKVYAVDENEGALDELIDAVKSEKLGNIVPIKASKNRLKNEFFDVILLYDILHYINQEERKKLYGEIHRILKVNGLLSVYPKHHKEDEPLWNLANMCLEGMIREIESANFYLEKKYFKKLLHDNHYVMGSVLNFRKRGEKI